MHRAELKLHLSHIFTKTGFGSAQRARKSLRKVASTNLADFGWKIKSWVFLTPHPPPPIFKPELFWRLAETSWKKISACPTDPPVPRQATLSDVTVVLSLKNPGFACPGHQWPSNKKTCFFSYHAEGEKRREQHRSPPSLQRALAARSRCPSGWQGCRQGCRQLSPRAGAAFHSHHSAAAFLSGQQFTSHHLFYSPFYKRLQGFMRVCTSIQKRAFFFLEIPAFASIQTCLLFAMP